MTEPNSHKRTFLVCLGLGIATFALFLPLRHCGFLNYDDNLYVTQNPLVSHGLSWQACEAALTQYYACNWHPVTTLSHMLDCQLWGLNPAGHHLMNVLIHTLNSLLLFALLRSTTGAFWRSALVAALFAWHPLRVESVAWVAERKDVLSTFFALLSLLAYAAYAKRQTARTATLPPGQSALTDPGQNRESDSKSQAVAPVKTRRRKRRFDFSRLAQSWYGPLCYLTALLLFALALMSKPMVVTLPFLMLLLDFWPLERFRKRAGAGMKNVLPLVWEKTPFLILSVASCLITLWVQQRGGAIESLEEIPLLAHFTNAVVAYTRYIGLMLYPVNLALPYPHPGHYPPVTVALAGLIVLGGTTLALQQFRRRPYLATGWFWYLGILVPVIGLIQVGDQAMADRYTYLPLVGLSLALVWGMADVTAARARWRRAAIAVAAVALIGCAITTEAQLRYWKNSETLFAHTLKVTRDNVWAEVNYGCALYDAHQYEAARSHFLKALKLKPKAAMTLLNAGRVTEELGNDSQALDYYQQALSARPDNPDIQLAHAHSLARAHRLDEANASYQAALAINPAHALLQCSYGLLLSQQGNTGEALEHLSEAIRLDPTLVAARLEIGNLFARAGRTDEAMAAFRQSVKVQPTNDAVHLSLGDLFEQLKQPENALSEYREAVRVQPDSARARSALGIMLAKNGNPAEAEIHFKRFTELEPTNADAYFNLGNVLLAAKNYAGAELQFSNALRLDSKDSDSSYKLAVCQARQGKTGLAAASLRATLQLNPNHPAALTDLAWMLAASSNPEIRNAGEAVKVARRACDVTAFGDTDARGALDAALAEAGRFPEAAEAAAKTRTLALALGQSDLAEAAAHREALYRDHQAFRIP